MNRIALALLVLALTGCSSFKLGGVAYCPYGQNCQFTVQVPGAK